MKNKEDWEVQFKKLFPFLRLIGCPQHDGLDHFEEGHYEVTDFIQTLLAEKEKETTSKLKEMVEGMKGPRESGYNDGHNQALDKVLDLLETEGKPKESETIENK